MLYEFLAANHDELVKRCKGKVVNRSGPMEGHRETEYGVSTLLGQLVNTLRDESGESVPATKVPRDIGNTAAMHGNELLLKGFSVDQVVHDYGDLCQAVTELAHEMRVDISVDEFHTFNRCLDNAIADAVTEYGRLRDEGVSEAETHSLNEQLGAVAHEQRNLLNSAILAFQALKGSNATVGGATGAVLGRSLLRLRDQINRSLSDARLTAGLQVQRERIRVRDLVDDLKISAELEAATKKIAFTAAPIDGSLTVDVDVQLLSAAIGNLIQNAFKFTHREGRVVVSTRVIADRVLIDVEDECGGLPPGKSEELFQPFSQRSPDRSGLGLGLSISRRSVEANGGTLSVRSLDGKGCIFTIDLPRGKPLD